jgi:hypothetical protein
MNQAKEICDKLSMIDVAIKYGFQPNRAGYIRCPFHEERSASLKCYEKPGDGFHCFGCGAGISAIDFVMKLFNLSFRQACLRLDADFKLDMINHSGIVPRSPAEAQELQARRMENARKLDEYERKSSTYRLLWWAKLNCAPKTPYEPIDKLYVDACHMIPILDNWFDENPYDRRWESL